VFGAKRLSVVRYLKQNNKTKITSGLEVDNKVFAVTGPERNVNSRQGTSCPENTLRLDPCNACGSFRGFARGYPHAVNSRFLPPWRSHLQPRRPSPLPAATRNNRAASGGTTMFLRPRLPRFVQKGSGYAHGYSAFLPARGSKSFCPHPVPRRRICAYAGAARFSPVPA